MAARTLLTKYSHEKTYRLREALAAGDDSKPAPPLQEFEPVQSSIAEAD